MLPDALARSIEALGMLPGVGPKTAERYGYYLFKANPKIADNIAEALASLHDGVKLCPKTFALINADDEVSELYSDTTRDKTTVMVVEEPLDIYAFEATKGYHGTYHVLGGVISPIDGVGPDELHIRELVERVKDDGVNEVIIATNPSVEGESTALLLDKVLHENSPDLKVTRLARGLPLGVDLSYADQITLSAALENRTKV